MDAQEVTKDGCGNCQHLFNQPHCMRTGCMSAPPGDNPGWEMLQLQKQFFNGTENRLNPKPTALPDDNPKTRFGLAKPSMACVPPGALIHLMRAMADGRRKYGLMNWREKTVSSTIYYDAAMRHLMSWLDGEEVASDSKVHHLGHVMACCAIILDAQANGKLNDDRPFKGSFAQLVASFTEKQDAAA